MNSLSDDPIPSFTSLSFAFLAGFCGWPTSLYLSEQGHDVIVLDNLSRRNIDIELGCSSLTPIESPEVRVKTWETVSGRSMRFVNLDVAKDYAELVQVSYFSLLFPFWD